MEMILNVKARFSQQLESTGLTARDEVNKRNCFTAPSSIDALQLTRIANSPKTNDS